MTRRRLTALDGWALLAAGLALAGSAGTLFCLGFIRDDQAVILHNPLLGGWSTLGSLLTTGYWEGAIGRGAPVQEYRPVLLLTYFFTARAAGFAPWAFHLGNVLLHGLNAFLLTRLLARRYDLRVAGTAAVLFAALPVHSEAVAYLSGRSELLLLSFLLAAWLDLEPPLRAKWRGLGWYALALGTKEQAVLFPAALALYEWVFDRERFWEPRRKQVYLGLFGVTAAYLAARFAVLPDPFHGGLDYFAGSGAATRVLTMARFAVRGYLWPMMTGLGLRSDHSRPFWPDSGPGDAAAWLSFFILAGILGVCAYRAVARRWRPAFWVVSGALYLLPVSNLVIRLDTIGAERFLYTPSVSFCVLAAQILAPAGNGALLPLAAWYLWRYAERNRIWLDERTYFQTMTRENPVSAGAWNGLAVALLAERKPALAEAALETAARLDGRHPSPHYNLGRLRWERGDRAGARAAFERSLETDAENADALLFLALLDHEEGRADRAEAGLRRCLELKPWEPKARFNLGKLLWESGRREEGTAQFREFLSLAPEDPDAPAIRALLASDGK